MANKSMRVLIFSTAYLPHIGGAELAVKEITDRLPEAEFDLITAKLKRGLPDFERMGNINVYRLGAGNRFFDKPLLPNLGFLKAVGFHKRKRYDLIHGVMASQGSATAYLFKLFYPKMPFVLTLQEGDLGRNSSFDRFWQRRIIKKADAITAISGYLADYARKFNNKVPVYVVPNGVDLGKYQVPKIKNQNDSRKKIIITVSRLVKKNGIDILINAVKQLEIDNWELQIIGDGPERKKLERIAAESGIADKIKFRLSVPNERIPEHLATADVFVRPSRSEGLGSAFLEAMASETAVIAGYVGGIRDFLEDGKTGLSCKAEDSHDLAKKISMILKDESLSKRLAENGRKLVEERYDWNRIAASMKEIYEKTINSHPGL